MKKCRCNFNPPRPYRPIEGQYMYIEGKSYLPEFFCDYCKGVIVNDWDYIKEVIEYYSYQQPIDIRSDDFNSDKRHRELERRRNLFLESYNEILAALPNKEVGGK